MNTYVSMAMLSGAKCLLEILEQTAFGVLQIGDPFRVNVQFLDPLEGLEEICQLVDIGLGQLRLHVWVGLQ